MFNPEKKSSSGDKQNKRLSKDEALAYQDYATSKEGAAFSEQAKDESYAEAEMFLEELQGKGIDLGKIDFKKIDLADLLVQDEISERLSKAILEYTKGKEREGILKKINEAMEKTGIKRVVALAVTLSILLSVAGVKSAEAGGQFMSKKDMGNENILQEKFSPEVSKVLIYNLDNGKIAFGYSQSGKIMDAHMDLRSNLNYDRAGWERYVLEGLNVKQVLQQASFSGFESQNINLDRVADQFGFFIQGLHARVEACEKLGQRGKITESRFIKKQITNDCERWQNKLGIGFLGNNFLQWLESKKSNDARIDLRSNLNYDRNAWEQYVLGELNVMEVLRQASFSGFESQKVAGQFSSFIQGLYARVEACEQLEQRGKIAESKSMKNLIIKDCEKWEKALGIGFLGTKFFRWLNH